MSADYQARTHLPSCVPSRFSRNPRWGTADAKGTGWCKARGCCGPGALVKFRLCAHISAEVSGGTGDKEKGPHGGAQARADRQLDTHLDVLPNPPATQGSSSGSASAQNGGILERDFALAFCSSSCPPGGRGTWTQRGRCLHSPWPLRASALPGAIPAGGEGRPALQLGHSRPQERWGRPGKALRGSSAGEADRVREGGRAGRAHLAGTRLQHHPRILRARFTEKLPPDSVHFILVSPCVSPSFSDMGQVSVIPALKDLRISLRNQSRNQGCLFSIALLSYFRSGFVLNTVLASSS